MYFLLGISLMLALLLVLNLLVSAAANGLWRALAPLAKNWTARGQARIIFALRIFPLAAALVFVTAFLLPAYFLFEPHSSSETVGFKLALLSFASTIGIAIAALRVFGTWWRTKRLVADWLANADLISVADVEIPVYRIRHSFPVIAIVGAFRPRMFVAEQVFASLDDNEFRAAICHEYGHIAARDNLKRTLMRICRDLLIFPFGRSLDQAWTGNIESAADEYAARIGGKSAALNLASALVKIARIAPRGAKPAMPSGAFLIETATADITWRVRCLLRLAEIKIFPAEQRNFKLKNTFWIYAGAFLAVLFLINHYDVLYKIHLALESVVRLLQ